MSGKCTCPCHTNPAVVHVMPCCHPAFPPDLLKQLAESAKKKR